MDHPAGFLQWVDGASEVGVERERLVVGKLGVETAGALLWAARPDWEGVQNSSPGLKGFLPLVASWLAAEAPDGSLARLGDLPNRPTSEEPASSDAERASEDALLLTTK